MPRPNAAASASNDRPASPSHGASPTMSTSARELHALLLEMFTSLNLTQRRFIDALRSLAKARHYLELGYASIHAYAEATFRIKKSQTYEFLRVSEALASLPEIAGAFEAGQISFSLTAKLTRVASAETEAEWLAFARERPVRETLAEIKDARKKTALHPTRRGSGASSARAPAVAARTPTAVSRRAAAATHITSSGAPPAARPSSRTKPTSARAATA